MTNENFMLLALKEANKANKLDEVPIGAVIVKNGKVISRGYNKKESCKDSTAHAEIIAIKKACKKLCDWRLDDCIMYVTLEPCAMCAGAIVSSRIKKVYYGATRNDSEKLSDIIFNNSGLNHITAYESGLMQQQCSEVIKAYFKSKRK